LASQLIARNRRGSVRLTPSARRAAVAVRRLLSLDAALTSVLTPHRRGTTHHSSGTRHHVVTMTVAEMRSVIDVVNRFLRQRHPGREAGPQSTGISHVSRWPGYRKGVRRRAVGNPDCRGSFQ